MVILTFSLPAVGSGFLYLYLFLSKGKILPPGFYPFIWPHHYSRNTIISHMPSLMHSSMLIHLGRLRLSSSMLRHPLIGLPVLIR
jgi:hypothetical protein